MAPRYWTCSRCHSRNERIKQRCTTPGCSGRRPKRRVPKHARTLRDDSYQVYVRAAEEIHGVTDESCCVCGRPRHQATRHHRDHDHVTGLPRGLACYQCNALMPRLLTLSRARAVVGYLERVDAHYAALEAPACIAVVGGVEFGQEANRPGDATNAPGHDTEGGSSMPDKLTAMRHRQQARFAALADLDERYMQAAPQERYEIVSEVLAGERCPHGFPDQGEGCGVCSGY